MVRQASGQPTRPPPQNELVSAYLSVPLITRAIISATLLLSICPHLGMIPYGMVMLDWSRGVYLPQFWKFITCFFVHGVNFNFIFTMIFLYRYSRFLETETFMSNGADYFYFIFLTMSVSLIGAKFLDLALLSGTLVSSILTLWSLENSETIVQFYFGFNFKGKYLPWVLAGLSFVMNAKLPEDDLLGIAVSYGYYYLAKTYVAGGGTNYLKTPKFLNALFPAPPGGFSRTEGYTVSTPSNESSNSNGGYSWGKGRKLGE